MLALVLLVRHFIEKEHSDFIAENRKLHFVSALGETGCPICDVCQARSFFKRCLFLRNKQGGLVSKQTMVLRRWGRERQNFGFINRVNR